jgi:hypothetical protein
MVARRAGYELGDPDRGAQAILVAVRSDRPPLRLPLGSDAYAYMKLTYESTLAELERTTVLTTLSTDFPQAASSVGELAAMFDRRG